MSHENDDRRIVDGFAELRRQTESRTPDFDAMMAKARTAAADVPQLTVVVGGEEGAAPAVRGDVRRRLTQAGGWVSLATAAAAAGLLLVQSGGAGADAEFEALVAAYSASASAGAWTSPTASLLDVPGLDLGSVPTFDGVLNAGDRSGSAEGRES
ncbi:MAG: hypothetical protein AAF389_12190 [Gemmatimonadota bacterium]